MKNPRWLRTLGVVAAVVIGIVLTLWATAALYFDLPWPWMRAPVAALYFLTMFSGLLLSRRQFRFLVMPVGFIVVLFWWLAIPPSNNRDWQKDVDHTAWADVDGDRVTVHNLRNCDYRAEFDYTCQWETRTYDLSKLSGFDLAITYWGSPWIAHPIATFDFGDEGYLPISIETRKVVGQGYSAIRGFFRQYELIYLVSDERDVIRLRTNFRTAEEVYLFHTTATPQRAREIFLDYLQRVNHIHDQPQWYNALTNNCTTNIALAAAESEHKPVNRDWRILLNGKGDQMLYENHQIVTDGLPLAELREKAHINSAARAADNHPDFSQEIRAGRPGFENIVAPTPQN
ncbi:MAG TPA: DUF4105 domain-containing protein [Terriglobales bacterium]